MVLLEIKTTNSWGHNQSGKSNRSAICLILLTLSQPGFFWAPKTKGAHCSLPPPPQKKAVTLVRIHSNKVFLKACPKMSLLTQRWFVPTPPPPPLVRIEVKSLIQKTIEYRKEVEREVARGDKSTTENLQIGESKIVW